MEPDLTTPARPRRAWSPPIAVGYDPPPSDRYRSPHPLEIGLQFAIGLSITVAVVSIASAIRAITVLDRVRDAPHLVAFSELEWIDARRMVLGLAAAVALVVVFGFLISLTRRLYRNVPTVSTFERRFNAGWAVGAWFVPVLSFVRPKQIIDDIWRANAVEESVVHGSARRSKVPRLLNVWWAATIVSFLVAWTRGDIPSDGDVDAVRDALAAGIVVDLVWIGWGILTMVVAHRLVDCERRRTRLVFGDGAAADGADTLATALLTTSVVGIAALVTGLVLFSSSQEARSVPVVANDGVEGRKASALAVGDCFDFPAGVEEADLGEVTPILGVGVGACDDLHDAEVIAVVLHPAGAAANYPGDDAVMATATRLCLEQFEPAIGRLYLESVLDIYLLVPQASWDLGDRSIQCAAYRMDGRQLSETVIGSGM